MKTAYVALGAAAACLVMALAAPGARSAPMVLCTDGVMRMSCATVRDLAPVPTMGRPCNPPVRGGFVQAGNLRQFDASLRPALWRR